MNTKKLKKRLAALKKQRNRLEKKHDLLLTKSRLTYWQGYALGYLKGKIWEIEGILEDLNL